MSISLENVSFRYSNSLEHDAVSIPSWRVETGEKVFLHGPSGSGKSTLLNILSGVLTVSDGEVCILGQRLDRMNQRQRDRFRANHIGYVFQQFNLIDYLSPIDNIRLAAHFSKATRNGKVLLATIEKTLTLLNIEQEQWLKPTSNLSIGQQQRVAIARALINQPELLIVDEPTSSLDHHNRDAFINLMMNMVEEHDMTLIFVSHDEALSKHFSRVDALPTINQTSTSP